MYEHTFKGRMRDEKVKNIQVVLTNCPTEMWSYTVEQFLTRFQLRFCLGGAKPNLSTAPFLDRSQMVYITCILLLSWYDAKTK